ncbi:MAG: hypothetical protein WAP36_09295 [Halanaerobiales bacterium]|jgi:hypothetical protein|nr:hypothetical protein [Halanaerobiales bacterium]
MKKSKIKKKVKRQKEPVIMPEAAYDLSPDDIEIGDDLIANREIKKEKKKKE